MGSVIAERHTMCRGPVYLPFLPFPKLSIYYPQKYLSNTYGHLNSHSSIVWLSHETFLLLVNNKLAMTAPGFKTDIL